MTDKAKSAELILKLYDLRREAVMREARDWFFSFNPESFEDIQRAVMSEHSAYLRMVTTYWDMACSFVNHGAIDAEMFNDPNAFLNLERAVTAMPQAEERLARARAMSKAVAQARAAAAAERTEADAANA
jgi:hypothetical protein